MGSIKFLLQFDSRRRREVQKEGFDNTGTNGMDGKFGNASFERLNNQLDTIGNPGTVFDELETTEMSVLNFGKLDKTVFRNANLLQQFLSLFVGSELNGGLHDPTGIVLKGNLVDFAPNQRHDPFH
mmetsp:Transcript_66674/g.100489  ORF Transcript_66674/g.100489 Transcript_66674/m.100489 type:complete len:126 (-) Transcript_66674:234-611(-)